MLSVEPPEWWRFPARHDACCDRGAASFVVKDRLDDPEDNKVELWQPPAER